MYHHPTELWMRLVNRSDKALLCSRASLPYFQCVLTVDTSTWWFYISESASNAELKTQIWLRSNCTPNCLQWSVLCTKSGTSVSPLALQFCLSDEPPGIHRS
uniref:Uncharacterized protein n=1 Tax=Arundo donax TaxID=35708 RepID=A0A0A9DHF4_ARUDO